MDLDEMVDEAWRDFGASLAEAIEKLETTSLIVPLDDPVATQAVPYVAVARSADGLTVAAPGNRALDEQHRLDEAGKRRLRRLGFRVRRGEGTDRRFATYPLGRSAEVASVAVTVLRDLFGVMHPTFLDRGDLDALLGTSSAPVRVEHPAPGAWVPSSGDGPGATYATDLDHLDLLIEEVIAELVGSDFSRDEDGDIPLISGTSVVYVHRAAGMPLIRLFSVMVVEVGDLDAADAEVVRLNREVDGVKFERRDDQVMASMDLVAEPFAPEHLFMLANHVCRVVSERDAEVAAAVRGRVFLDQQAGEAEDDAGEHDPGVEEAEPSGPRSGWESVRHRPGAQIEWEGVHPVMRTIQRIESEKPGSLRPKAAARLCSNDPVLVAELLQWSETHARSWRFAREAATRRGDEEEAEACEHLRAHAARTVRVLRKALKLLNR